jgi:hypothetical protein
MGFPQTDQTLTKRVTREHVRFWHLADIPAYPDLCPLLGVKRTL